MESKPGVQPVGRFHSKRSRAPPLFGIGQCDAPPGQLNPRDIRVVRHRRTKGNRRALRQVQAQKHDARAALTGIAQVPGRSAGHSGHLAFERGNNRAKFDISRQGRSAAPMPLSAILFPQAPLRIDRGHELFISSARRASIGLFTGQAMAVL